MPTIYLSPSTQQFNEFVNGGTEEQYMNLIVDAMIPVLQANNIQYVRNTPDMTAGSSIRQSNAGNYDLHLAVHSNASGEGQQGQNRGTIAFYYPTSTNGKRFADIIVSDFKTIYPNPALVKTTSTTSLGEVSRTRAPSVLVEVAYHDNVEDANWIKNNISTIGQTLARSVVQYFSNSTTPTMPATPTTPTTPTTGQTGTVTLQSGYLNIRSGPSLTAPVIGMAPNGAKLTILGKNGEWYNIRYNGTTGYVHSRYVRV